MLIYLNRITQRCLTHIVTYQRTAHIIGRIGLKFGLQVDVMTKAFTKKNFDQFYPEGDKIEDENLYETLSILNRSG